MQMFPLVVQEAEACIAAFSEDNIGAQALTLQIIVHQRRFNMQGARLLLKALDCIFGDFAWSF